MSFEKLNSVGGLSVGIPAVDVVAANGIVVADINANVVQANTFQYSNGQPISGSAAGANTEVQFNAGNSQFGASPDFTFDSANGLLTITNVSTTGIVNLGNVSNVVISGGDNGYFLQTDGTGNLVWAAGGGGGGNGNPGGSNTQVQFNDAGTFGGVTGFTFNKSTGTLTVPILTANTVNGNVAHAVTANTVVDNQQPNITSLGTLSSLAVSGNANVGNIGATYGVFTNVSGNGSALSSITGANIIGAVPIATNVTANAQPNITSVGNLSSLSVIGNIRTGNLTSIGNANVTGLIVGSSANLGGVGNVKITGGTSGQYLQTDGTGNLTWSTSTGGNGTPGGTNTQVQFNNAGAFGGVSGFAFNNTTGVLTVPNVSASGNITSVNANLGNAVTANYFIGNGTPMTFNTSANIIYVATNGNDSNNGSINKPFLTIKAALTAASSGNVSVHVAPGIYTEANPITIPANVALMGDNLRNVTVIPQTPASDLFYVSNGCYVWGITIKNYTANGFSFNPATPSQNVFVSPYIQNLTSSTTTGTAVFVDGSKVSNTSTKAMIVGFFTIINQGGKGIRIVNSGYSQLVNIYTIACDIGIQVESGGFCTLNGSDCSIGNYGLSATGYGPLQTAGSLVSQTNGVFVIDTFTNGQPHVNTVLIINGDANYYTIDTIIPNAPSAGKATVAIQQVYNGTPSAGTTISFYTRSAIIASAHTFEYVGAGTNPATALPQYGGIPIEENEVIETGGGVVTFTSTDQKGNFKVGKGFTINQASGTITGTDFYVSLFAQMTPYILALGL